MLALAALLRLDLTDVEIVPMGGATSIRTFLTRYRDAGARVGALVDEREARVFARAGLDEADSFVCRADLEDELIRALGADAVIGVIEAAGDGASWERMRKQPAQRDRLVEQQLRRFLGTRSGRKERYATLLVEALDPANVPAPLVAVLRWALSPSRS